MKKYHIADILTLLETILAVALFIMAFLNLPPDIALWVFVAGELCDAADGPCARRWHYPDDGKYRWWRHYNSEIDQASDILLSVAGIVYLILCVNAVLGFLLFGIIGLFSLYVNLKVFRYDRKTHSFQRRKDCTEAKMLILLRRRLYVVVGVGGGIALLLWFTEYRFWVKIAWSIFGITCGIVLRLLKDNRWNQDKTAL